LFGPILAPTVAPNVIEVTNIGAIEQTRREQGCGFPSVRSDRS